MANINFYSKGIDFQLNDQKLIRNWLNFVGKSEKIVIEEIIYFFVSEKEILKINSQFLNHKYKTDVITFNENFISSIKGEIYICIDVIIENCKIYSKGDFYNELCRVLVHGLLHLIGYNDQSIEESIIMKNKENFYLELLLKIE